MQIFQDFFSKATQKGVLWGVRKKNAKQIMLEPNNLLSLCQIHQNFFSGVNLPKTNRVVPSKMQHLR